MKSSLPTLTDQEPKEYDLPRQCTGYGIVIGDVIRRYQGAPDRQIGACRAQRSGEARQEPGWSARAPGRIPSQGHDRGEDDRDVSVIQAAGRDSDRGRLQLPLCLEITERAVIIDRGDRRVGAFVAVAPGMIVVRCRGIRERVQSRAA